MLNQRRKKEMKRASLVREDLVAFYKKKIDRGEYAVKSDAIAERIVQNIKEQPIRQLVPSRFGRS